MTSTTSAGPLAPPPEPQAPPELLRAMFDAAVAAADPARVVPDHLPDPPSGRTVVVGAGKAAAAMARALETAWLRKHGEARLEGLVVTRYGYAVPCERIDVVEAAHPVPDEAGVRAAARMLDLVDGLGADDLVIALISGGGSALLSSPPDGVDLADLQALTGELLRSGAPISSVNLVRRHVSVAAGGRLAVAAHPARVLGLVISDVPGDDPATIASGPTAADTSEPRDALRALDRLGVTVPDSVRSLLSGPATAPHPGDTRLAGVTNVVVAAAQSSLEAAARVAREAGVPPVILGDSIEGESREVASVLAGIARQVRRHGQPRPAPCVLISGGETTVTVRGAGRGGPNAEFALALALALRGEPGIWGVAGDTDGVDGVAEVAGAIVGPDTLQRAGSAGLDAAAALADNDAHSFFAGLGDQVVTGPTNTNVNDFRAVLVE